MLALLAVALSCAETYADLYVDEEIVEYGCATERSLWYSVQNALTNARHHGRLVCELSDHPFFFVDADDTVYCGQLDTGEWHCTVTICGRCIDELPD